MIDLSNLSTIAGTIISALTGGSFGWMLRSTRRKANAEANATEIDSLGLALNQIKELLEEMSTNSKKLRTLNEDMLRETERRHQLEMQLLTTRCDIIGCTARRPPLPWLNSQAETTTNESNLTTTLATQTH